MKKKGDTTNISDINDASKIVEEDIFIRKYSIQQQITKGIAVILGIIATIAAIAVFVIGRYYVIHEAGLRYEEIANSSALFVHHSLSERADFLEKISESAVLQNALNNNEPGILDESINHYLAQYPDLEGLWILTKDGNVFAYNQTKEQAGITWNGLTQKNYSNEEWFYKCKNSKNPEFYMNGSEFKTDEANLPKNLFLWTQPISGGKGCILLFENSTLISEDLFKKINFARKNLKIKSIQAHVIAQDGSVLYSTDSEWNKYVGSKEKYNPITQYIKGVPTGTERENVHNNRILFSWSNIKDNLTATENLYVNATIVIQVNMQEILRPLYYLVLMLIGLVVFVTSAASFLVYTQSKKLVYNPIVEIEEAMDKASSGDFSQNALEIFEKNDIGLLTLNLNRLIEKIRTMLLSVLENGKEVVAEGRVFFINLGTMQESALKIKKNLTEATNIVGKISHVAEDIYQNAINQQSLAGANRAAMDNLKTSFEQSSIKRTEITLSAKNVVQKSNSGLQTIAEFANNVEKIAESSKKIRGIINIIDNISDQTNLLALNASIEAARAGVHGQGFSVVANEISELAKRSARSAEEITNLIKETVQQVLDVSNKVENAKGFFKQIAEMMTKLDKEIIEMAEFSVLQETSVLETANRAQKNAMISQEISEITKTQTEYTESLNKIMTQIDQLSSENRIDIEKDDQLLQLFMERIQNLMQTANQFKLSREVIAIGNSSLK